MPPVRVALLGTLILLSLLMFHPLQANGAPFHSYSILVSPGKIPVSIMLNIQQNLTSMQNSFAFPITQSVLSGANSTSLAQQFEKALQTKNLQARVADFALQASSSPWSNSTRRQWLNVSLGFNVLGVTKNNGAIENADLSWKSFNIGSNVTVAGVELNNIGADYLASPAQKLSNLTSSQFVRAGFQVNGKATNGLFFAAFVATINTFNFTGLSSPVASWRDDHDFDTNSRGWSLESGPVLGMAVTRTLQEAENITTLTNGVFYSLTARVSAPGRASINGDIITVDYDATSEKIMGLTIFGVTLVGLGAFVYERRILRQSSVKGKKNRAKS